jgi:hypothetical protein
MSRLLVHTFVLAAFGLAGRCLTPSARAEQNLATAKWVKSIAYVVPKETATEGEGYFSIIEGLNGRLYIGTHANAVNSWLVEFDPAVEKMKVVMGSGAAIFDFDGDGRRDLYLLQNGGPDSPSKNRLFRQGAAGRFTSFGL